MNTINGTSCDTIHHTLFENVFHRVCVSYVYNRCRQHVYIGKAAVLYDVVNCVAIATTTNI